MHGFTQFPSQTGMDFCACHVMLLHKLSTDMILLFSIIPVWDELVVDVFVDDNTHMTNRRYCDPNPSKRQQLKLESTRFSMQTHHFVVLGCEHLFVLRQKTCMQPGANQPWISNAETWFTRYQ